MKRKFTLVTLISLIVLGFVLPVNAQEEAEPASPFSVGADVVSSYVWRGTKYSGPAIQPSIEYSISGFTIGTWGSFGFADEVAEADLYASYGFDFGLSLGLTDYYYQHGSAGEYKYFQYSGDTANHAFEINVGYEIKGVSISGNYILNDASKGGAGSQGGDKYFELGYAFKNFNVFVGAGDGWHTSNGNFNLCNIGIGTSKEVKITDSYSLPVSGSVVLNPEKEQFNIVVGISF